MEYVLARTCTSYVKLVRHIYPNLPQTPILITSPRGVFWNSISVDNVFIRRKHGWEVWKSLIANDVDTARPRSDIFACIGASSSSIRVENAWKRVKNTEIWDRQGASNASYTRHETYPMYHCGRG